MIKKALQRLLDGEPYLKPYRNTLERRLLHIRQIEETITPEEDSLAAFAARSRLAHQFDELRQAVFDSGMIDVYGRFGFHDVEMV